MRDKTGTKKDPHSGCRLVQSFRVTEKAYSLRVRLSSFCLQSALTAFPLRMTISAAQETTHKEFLVPDPAVRKRVPHRLPGPGIE